ncbi:hypothetical protein [Arenibacter latericius]|uniref:hypothetical protein n=1 Tax=Arenibacter latericius TaxID=86104 RepID=UPI0004206182|nr:hypothetical protein [Arenibacter latericius]
MAKIIIERKSEWNNKARDFEIYLDGEKVGSIRDGNTLEIEVEPGRHQLIAKIDWCRSNVLEIELNENTSKVIALSGFKYGAIIMPVLLGIILAYLISKYAFNVELNFLLILTSIGFLYPLYFITFGKNNYLVINESS